MNAIAVRDPAWQAEWAQMCEVAKAVSNTGYVPRDFRGKPDDVLATIVAGNALGLKPMVALMNCAVIDGRPTFEGQVLLALIRKHGHSVRILETSPTKVTVVGRRRDNGDEHTVTWTIERAQTTMLKKRDGSEYSLASKNTWKSYPEAMLTWRAVTELARFLFPDITMGLASYTAEELGSDDPAGVERIIVDTETGEILPADGVLEAVDPQGRKLTIDEQGTVEVIEDAEYTTSGHSPDCQCEDCDAEDIRANTPEPEAETTHDHETTDDDDIDFDDRPPLDRLEAAIDSAATRGLKGWTRTAVLARAKKSWPEVKALADLSNEQVDRIIERLNEKLRDAGLEEAA